MSPVPKSPISREESSRRDDSQNFVGLGGINLEVANMDASAKQITTKSKSQHVKQGHKGDPFPEPIVVNEPKKTFFVREGGLTKQQTSLERVSEQDSDEKEQQQS